MFYAIILSLIAIAIKATATFAPEFVPLLAPYAKYLTLGANVIVTGIVANICTHSISAAIKTASKKYLGKNSITGKLFPLLEWGTFWIIWIIAGITILSLFEVDIRAITTGAGIGWVLLALAGKETMSNLIGTLSIIFGKTFAVGETIRVKGFEGKVQEIGLGATVLIDAKGNRIHVPNKTITTETIENLSAGKRTIRETTVTFPGKLSNGQLATFREELAKFANGENDEKIEAFPASIGAETSITVKYRVESSRASAFESLLLSHAEEMRRLLEQGK